MTFSEEEPPFRPYVPYVPYVGGGRDAVGPAEPEVSYHDPALAWAVGLGVVWLLLLRLASGWKIRRWRARR